MLGLAGWGRGWEVEGRSPRALVTLCILTLYSALWTTVAPTCPLIFLFLSIPCNLEKKLRERWGYSVCVCVCVVDSLKDGAKAERAEVWV